MDGTPSQESLLWQLRRQYHQSICNSILHVKKGVTKGKEYECPSIADTNNTASMAIAALLVERLGYDLCESPEEEAGAKFANLTLEFIQKAFDQLTHLRPGPYDYKAQGGIQSFDQYEHLTELLKLSKELDGLPKAARHYRRIRAAFQDYLIKPDITIARIPLGDETINSEQVIVGEPNIASLTPLRAANRGRRSKPILHASVSCKWTLRSDRAQNARTESLNLLRNRRGHTPHIVLITMEPLPTRIASAALGADIDCTYHAALDELTGAVKEYNNPAVTEMLDVMLEGRRLRDISDLALDLAI